MSLEASTYISGLTSSWPTSGDFKTQGDDHIRLIKLVLQNTFPNASKPFRFPTAEATAALMTLDSTDQNNFIMVTTTGGNVNIALPSGFGVTEAGWSCDIVKVSNDANAVIVSPASGTITSKCGTTATIRVGILAEPARFIWTGTTWICSKPGTMIGSTEDFDGPAVPPGYLAADGSAYSSTSFAELFAVLGTTTLLDKRGRMTIGDGTGTGLTARVQGTQYGSETFTLAEANLPAHDHDVFLKESAHDHGVTGGVTGGTSTYNNFGNFDGLTAPIGASTIDVQSALTGITIGSVDGVANDNRTATAGSGTAVSKISPSIAVKKIVRAC